MVCQWFISLTQRDQFTSAVWKASNDVGFDAFRDFIKGTKKSAALPSEEGASKRPQPKVKGHQSTKQSKPGVGVKSSVLKKGATATESHVRLTLACTHRFPLLYPSQVPTFIDFSLFLHHSHLSLSSLFSLVPVFPLNYSSFPTSHFFRCILSLLFCPSLSCCLLLLMSTSHLSTPTQHLTM